MRGRPGHPSALTRLHPWTALAALLAATWLRTLPLMDNRFHPDEALYGAFARRIASGQGILLTGLVVDKPPLAFYLDGLSVAILGGNEFALRLPVLYASLISVALVFAVARSLYDSRTAVLATWITALSPFAILFSITVFIDPLLMAGLLAGLGLVLRRRAGWAIVAFALAFATKQTALIFVPLPLAFVCLRLPESSGPREALHALGRFSARLAVALALTLAAIFVWEQARHAPIGFWEQGFSDNMPGRFVRTNEVLPRARVWLDWLHYFTASPGLNRLFVVVVPVLLLFSSLHPSRAALADFLLAGFLMLYLAGYWLLAFNVWDRYLVPILPLMAILLARVLCLVAASLSLLAYRVWRRLPPAVCLPPSASHILPFAFCLLLLPPALNATRSGYPVGGDHGAYDGIEQVARFVRGLPAQGVVYDHWLGWEFDFYLFEPPIYIAWFPTPGVLKTDLRAFGHTSPRYLVVPSWESDLEVRAAAHAAGFEFAALFSTTRRDGSVSFVVYQLVPIGG